MRDLAKRPKKKESRSIQELTNIIYAMWICITKCCTWLASNAVISERSVQLFKF
jgi:hypothetical protein